MWARGEGDKHKGGCRVEEECLEKGLDWRMKRAGTYREGSKNVKGIEESFWRNRKLSGIDKSPN
jgi:hypothetical protein